MTLGEKRSFLLSFNYFNDDETCIRSVVTCKFTNLFNIKSETIFFDLLKALLLIFRCEAFEMFNAIDFFVYADACIRV